MPPPLQPSTLLHHNQVLTVKKAACWVQYLIDHYSQSVKTLTPFTLEECALEDYAKQLGTLVEHAGVLEQLLCRMCFFLPDEVVQTVVAIVVTTHYQLSLIRCNGVERFVLNTTIVASMSEYLEHVAAHLDAIHVWVQSGEYARLSRAIDDALSGMKRSFSSFLAHMDAATIPEVITPALAEGQTTHISHEALDSLLVTLSRFTESSSVPEADWVILSRNFTPLVFDEYAYTHPEVYACATAESQLPTGRTPSPSTTAHSGSPRASLKGKERCLFDDSPSSSSTRKLSASPQPSSSATFPPVPGPSPAGSPNSPPHHARTKRRRSRSESRHLSKRRRVSVRVYGVDGCLSDCSTHEAVVARVKPYVGNAVPLTSRLTPSSLPTLPLAASPISDGSVSSPAYLESFAGPSSGYVNPRTLEPPPLGDRVQAYTAAPLPAPFRSAYTLPFSLLSVPFPHLYDDDSDLSHPTDDGRTVEDTVDACSTLSDESDALSYVTALDSLESMDESDASVAAGSTPMPVMVNARIQSTRARKTTATMTKHRRCLVGLLQSIKQIFGPRA